MSSVYFGSGDTIIDTIEAHHTPDLIYLRIGGRSWYYNLLSELPLSNVTETETCEELE